jgi:hypothetical protein
MDKWLDAKQKLIDIGFDAINTSTMWLSECKVRGKYTNLLINNLNKFSPLRVVQKYKYKEIIKHMISEFDTLENVYPTLVPQWDHSPRSGKNGVIYHNSTPELFRNHTKMILNCVKSKEPEHRIVILKSWNEWGESNYVEPDLRFGKKYLVALSDELNG